jgi:hypothetical protein
MMPAIPDAVLEAFEVDEVDGPVDWRSIVARGTVYLVHEAGPLTERAT